MAVSLGRPEVGWGVAFAAQPVPAYFWWRGRRWVHSRQNPWPRWLFLLLSPLLPLLVSLFPYSQRTGLVPLHTAPSYGQSKGRGWQASEALAFQELWPFLCPPYPWLAGGVWRHPAPYPARHWALLALYREPLPPSHSRRVPSCRPLATQTPNHLLLFFIYSSAARLSFQLPGDPTLLSLPSGPWGAHSHCGLGNVAYFISSFFFSLSLKKQLNVLFGWTINGGISGAKKYDSS